MVTQAQTRKDTRGQMFGRKVKIPDLDAPLKPFGVSGQPIHTRQYLQQIAAHFHDGTVSKKTAFDLGGYIHDFIQILQNSQHPFRPGTGPEPFGERNEAIFHVFSTAKHDLRSVNDAVFKSFFTKRIGIG
ncbi:hypothetical protein [Runella sp.]|uniref:hypothetical protein n=1 Tax=Runella sp. TaxID=1960881 RepID=UPI00301B3A95